MAENGPIEQVAKIVSEKLFERFKWKQYGPMDQDFGCHKEVDHKPADKQQKHTHPVDVVFSYKDPYLNKTIYLNTDLKSYAKDTIKAPAIESALISLAKTIDCAETSEEWNTKYNISSGNFEVRECSLFITTTTYRTKISMSFLIRQYPKVKKESQQV